MSDSVLPEAGGDLRPPSGSSGPARVRAPGAIGQETAWRRAMPIYYALLLAIATVGVALMLVRLRHVLVLLFVSALFAASVDGPARWLERFRVPRALAAVLMYALVLVGVVALGWVVLPPLARQVATFAADLPAHAERYRDLRERYDDIRARYPGLETFEGQLADISNGVLGGVTARLARLPTTVFGVFLDVLSVFVISIMLVTNRERMTVFGLSLMHIRHRERTAYVLDRMWERLGHYLRAKAIVMVVIGAITYVALRLIGLPYPLLLAVIVGLGEAIPRAGPWIARLPLLSIALIEGVGTLGITFAASVVIENAKGYVISPFVEGDQLDIHPLLVFVSVLVGAALLGPAGAFIAVPLAAMIQVLAEEVIIPWRRAQVDQTDTALTPG